MAEQWLLFFRARRADMTFSCTVQSVQAECGDALKGEIERIAMKLESETGVPWLCESVRPLENIKPGGKNDA